jgi:hypothetical protein
MGTKYSTHEHMGNICCILYQYLFGRYLDSYIPQGRIQAGQVDVVREKMKFIISEGCGMVLARWDRKG